MAWCSTNLNFSEIRQSAIYVTHAVVPRYDPIYFSYESSCRVYTFCRKKIMITIYIYMTGIVVIWLCPSFPVSVNSKGVNDVNQLAKITFRSYISILWCERNSFLVTAILKAPSLFLLLNIEMSLHSHWKIILTLYFIYGTEIRN